MSRPQPRDFLRKKATKGEAAALANIRNLMAATAASARHNAIIDVLEAMAAARTPREIGLALGALEAKAREMLTTENARAGIRAKPRPIPAEPAIWTPPSSGEERRAQAKGNPE